MNKKDLEFFKGKLLKEKTLLEEELSSVARKNTKNPDEWEATTGGMEVDNADENEVADLLEELEDNEAIATQLQAQLKDVNDALVKIDAGTYGTCEVTGEQIEYARLEANPSARTTIKKVVKS